MITNSAQTNHSGCYQGAPRWKRHEVECLSTQFIHVPHTIDPDETVASVIERIPEALPFLIQLGFTPLAELLDRERFAPVFTIRDAAETLPFNLDCLLTDLDRLAARSFVST
jgi:hypothetical protein